MLSWDWFEDGYGGGVIRWLWIAVWMSCVVCGHVERHLNYVPCPMWWQLIGILGVASGAQPPLAQNKP